MHRPPGTTGVRAETADRPASPAGTPATPVVFYDGGCPLCRREIAHYRRLDTAARLHWVDAAADGEALAAYGLDYPRAMAELHVLDDQGRWQRGIDAFLQIWNRLPGYRRLAWLVTRLGLRGPLGWAYRRFAAWRYRRRCADGCALPDRAP